ncbi:MAG TPA: heparan-alpha-glucosaminide N-acetyltransferase domain-containing protein [Chitinophagaceae bacterium]|nr:heparan-alpha-glucosaminide N-acetyltransferase domain-containing protein [Chitinophagaceae bacterium]
MNQLTIPRDSVESDLRQLTVSRTRIQSIDIVRGVVMVIMAIDHVRDFFYKAPVSSGASVATNPTDLATTTPALFFTRWFTHFCAPIFVFLAGTSIFLMSQKKSKSELSSFLIKRGIWLVLVELILITFSWTFNPFYNFIILQVIWALGVSMIVVGLLIRLPMNALLVIGLAIVFGHNLLNYPSINHAIKSGWLADLLYFSNFSAYNLDKNHVFIIVYAFVPWTGVMLLGYCLGKLFVPGFNAAKRKRILLRLGFSLWAIFLVLRFINNYGDPVPWSKQPRGDVFTFLSFMNVNKYPPSLDFLCVTIGGGLIALALFERSKSGVWQFFRVYGRVPMFYYILHLYLIHLIGVMVFFAEGFSVDQIVTPNNPFFFRPSAFGFGLWGVYIVWLIVVLVLYPACKKYDHYKSTHRKWWLSYL